MPLTLYEKLWEAHRIADLPDGQTLIAIDRHLVQEVSSPQAFEGLVLQKRTVRRPDRHLSVADHAVTTRPGHKPPAGSLAALQLQRLEDNVSRFGLPYIPMDDPRHGIVHIIGPELGFTLPGCTLVCGDSHTSTHGAFGALAFGIGSSQCETVLATQCLQQDRLKPMRIRLNGQMGAGVTVKDIILHVIGLIGVDGGRGHAIEYAGSAIAGLSMEARMTLCNMTIEAGARIGMVAPDEVTFAYLKGRPLAPAGPMWDQAVAYWRTLQSDDGAVFARDIEIHVSEIAPHVTWGTTPADCAPITGKVPDPADDPARAQQVERALAYMNLVPGTSFTDIAIDRVFIGSCTNARIEDLRRAAGVARGRRVAAGVSAMVVPGSAQVQAEAEAEGLDRVFLDAGFEWRNAGCSMCVAMNEDRLEPGQRCASTSNRNFEGRQGPDGRTHLMSPEMAAAAAVTGRLTDVRTLMETSHG
ncbi:3-isopropylmalate dehydratase large subunit [Polymorphobacter sp.]|uniref:3-isopropylmalate dehydratase large subunit n=1 Tax=Polymorphobacter sp. TaxID=1909290 RepID=UPI003F721A73